MASGTFGCGSRTMQTSSRTNKSSGDDVAWLMSHGSSCTRQGLAWLPVRTCRSEVAQVSARVGAGQALAEVGRGDLRVSGKRCRLPPKTDTEDKGQALLAVAAKEAFRSTGIIASGHQRSCPDALFGSAKLSFWRVVERRAVSKGKIHDASLDRARASD